MSFSLFFDLLSLCKVSEYALENKKHDLLRAVQDTRRGLLATVDQRSLIEEALVCSSTHYFSALFHYISGLSYLALTAG